MGAQSSGRLLVVSAPSGTGKSTVCRRLLATRDDVAMSISYTTRAPRAGERHGEDYHFVDERAFDAMIDDQAFLEWAHVHGHRYGSRRAEMQRLLATGKDVLFDVDVQGGRQIKEQEPEALLVFLLPPSIDALAERLRRRGTESEKQIAMRLFNVRWELEQGESYDYHVVNDDLDVAVAGVDRIRRGRARPPRKRPDLLRDLIRDTARYVIATN